MWRWKAATSASPTTYALRAWSGGWCLTVCVPGCVRQGTPSILPGVQAQAYYRHGRLPLHESERLPLHVGKRLPPHVGKRLPLHESKRPSLHESKRLPLHESKRLPLHESERLPLHESKRLSLRVSAIPLCFFCRYLGPAGSVDCSQQ